jgi:hypothetical protein
MHLKIFLYSATLLLITPSIEVRWHAVIMLLPRDCIDIVISYIPIVHVVNVSLALCKKSEIRDVIQYRIGYKRLLRKIVRDPDELLRSMQEQKYILMSDCISQYFVPTSSGEQDIWEFIVMRESWTNESCIHPLEEMGISPNENEEFTDVAYDQTIYRMCHQKYGEIGQSIQIRVVDKEVFDYVSNFPVSAMRCFFTHLGAIHMYGKISSLKKMILSEGGVEEFAYIAEQINTRCPMHSSFIDLEELIEGFVPAPFAQDARRLGDVRDYTPTLRQFIKDNMHRVGPIPGYSSDPMQPVKDLAVFVRDGFEHSESNEVEELVLSDDNCLHTLIIACVAVCKCTGNSALETIHKYEEYGYTTIEFNEYSQTTKGWQGDDGEPEYRSRALHDSESTIVPFYCPMMKHTDEDMQKMARYSWYEYNEDSDSMGNGYSFPDSTGIGIRVVRSVEL